MDRLAYIRRMGEAPADFVARVEAGCRVYETPCGDGSLVWRVWGDGDPVILLHGGSGSWTHWIKTIPQVGERYELWVPDLPGLGDSAMPPMPHVPATVAEVLAEGFRMLFEAHERPHVVGFSFGAHVGTCLATLIGQRLRSLTLSGCAALGLPHRHVVFAKEHSRMTPQERAEVHRSNLEILMIADPARIDDLAIHLQAGNIAKARFRSRAFAGSDEIRRLLPWVPLPMAAVWGERDQIATPTVQARFDILREHHPELIARIVPAAGHWAAYEQSFEFNLALLEVLDMLDRS